MKILIIRFSSIGDIVLTTPVMRCIKNQLPASEIHFAIKKQYYPIVESNPYIHKVHCLENSLPHFIDQLDKEKFDCIIDLHKNMRSFFIKGNLGIRTHSFKKMNFKKWLMVRFKIKSILLPHIVERYMDAVKPLNVFYDDAGLDYFIPEKDSIDIASIPAPHNRGYIAFVIGATYYTKKLPTEKIIELCAKLNAPVILIGGKEDHANGEIIASSAPQKILNACGKYSLNQSASLIRSALRVITHDTGMMHIAAAFNKEIISVWGNTVPGFGMYPYLKNKLKENAYTNKSIVLEVKDLYCRPCSKIGFNKCPQGHFKCMRNISFDEII